jgi:uncharacterized membrane protein YbhN (UPF0104 family)
LKSSHRSALLRLGISLGLLIVLFRVGVDPKEVAGRLGTAIATKPQALGLAVFLYCILGTLVRGRRWQALVSGLGHPFSVWRATELFLVGTFFNQILPTGIGGDLVRALAAARDGLGKTRAFSSVLVDRALGLLPMLAIGLFALPSAWGHIEPRLRLPMLLIGSAGLVGLLSLLWIDHLAAWIRLVLPRWLPTAVHQPLDRFVASVTEYDRASLAKALGWGTVFSVLLIGTNAALGQAVGIDRPGLLHWAIVVPLVAMSTIMPSIGGWGVREALYASLLAGQPEAAVALSVLFGLLNMLLAAVGGVLAAMGESVGLPRLDRLRADGQSASETDPDR